MSREGEFRLKLSGTLKDLVLFHGEQEVALPETGEEVELTLSANDSERQRLTLVGLKSYGLDDVAIELLDDASTTQLVPLLDF